jgi:Arc/MetJ family transcription regulator
MTRTNVVIDEEIVERVKKLYGLPTTRAAIDFALRSLLPSDDPRDILDLEGAGWDGDLEEMRRKRT